MIADEATSVPSDKAAAAQENRLLPKLEEQSFIVTSQFLENLGGEVFAWGVSHAHRHVAVTWRVRSASAVRHSVRNRFTIRYRDGEFVHFWRI
jgi:hypothetical protein